MTSTNDTYTETDYIQIPFGIPKNAKHLYEGSWGNHLWVFKENNRTVQQFGFQLVGEDGLVSEPVFQKRDHLLGKTGFNFIFNLAGDYDKADLDSIRNEFMKIQHKLESMQLIERCDFVQVYRDLYKYVAEHQLEDVLTLDTEKECQYANIPMVDIFDKVVMSHEWGWKPIEVKRTLKRLGLLRINKGRPFDYAKYDKDNSQYRVISIRYANDWEGLQDAD